MKKLLFLLLFIFSQACGDGFGLETLIAHKDGYRPLKSVQKGDHVASYDFRKGTIESKKILMVDEREVDSYIKLKHRDTEVICACDQKFYLPALKKWVKAEEALTNPEMQEIFYHKFHIYAIEKVNEKIKLGVLTVEHLHNFFVQPMLLAHNHPAILIFGPTLYGGPAIAEGVVLAEVVSATLGSLFILVADYIINKPKQRIYEDNHHKTSSNLLNQDSSPFPSLPVFVSEEPPKIPSQKTQKHKLPPPEQEYIPKKQEAPKKKHPNNYIDETTELVSSLTNPTKRTSFRVDSLIKLNALEVPIGTYSYHRCAEALEELKRNIFSIAAKDPDIFERYLPHPEVTRAVAQFFQKVYGENAEKFYIKHQQQGIFHFDYDSVKDGPRKGFLGKFKNWWDDEPTIPYLSAAEAADYQKLISLISQGSLDKAHQLVNSKICRCNTRAHITHHEQLARFQKLLERHIPKPKPSSHKTEKSAAIHETVMACIPDLAIPHETPTCGTEATHQIPSLPETTCGLPEATPIPPAACLPEDSGDQPLSCGTGKQKLNEPHELWQCNFGQQKIIEIPLIKINKEEKEKPSDDEQQTEATPKLIQPEDEHKEEGSLQDILEKIKEIAEKKRSRLIDEELDKGIQAAEIHRNNLKEFIENKSIPESAKAKGIQVLEEFVRKAEQNSLNKALEIEKIDIFDERIYEVPPEVIQFPEVNLDEIMQRIEELKQDPRIIALQKLYNETPAFRTFEEIQHLPGTIVGENGEHYRFPGPVEAMNPKDEQNNIIANEWCKKINKEIINNTFDIENISQETGISKDILNQIKKHLFLEKHYLDLGYKKFDPHPQQTAAWIRLTEGDFIKNDIQWLIHELAESELLKGAAKNYVRPAHELLDNNGYRWHTP